MIPIKYLESLWLYKKINKKICFRRVWQEVCYTLILVTKTSVSSQGKKKKRKKNEENFINQPTNEPLSSSTQNKEERKLDKV